MAYQANVTNNIEPVAQDLRRAGHAAEATAEFGRAVVGAAGDVYSAKRQFDIATATDAAKGLKDTFFDSNMAAEVAARDMATNSARETALMQDNKDLSQMTGLNEIDRQQATDAASVNLGALKNIREEAARLKDASEGGMSNTQYVARVAALTKKTILQYPGLGDQIRAEVGRITGLPGADEFASNAFVRERFSPKQADKALVSPDEIIKNVASLAGVPILDVANAYQKNPSDFQRYASIARGNSQLKAQQEALKNQQDSVTIVSDQQARAQIPVLQAMAQLHGMEAYLNLQKQLPTEQLNRLLDQSTTPAEKENVLKQYAAQGSWYLDTQKAKTLKVIDDINAKSGGTISKDTLAEMRANVEQQYKQIKDEYMNPMGQLAVLGVMREYSDKTYDQQIKLAGANAAFLQSVSNNTYVQAWFAGGASRENVKRQFPELDALLSTHVDTATKVNASINDHLNMGGQINIFSAGSKNAETTMSPEPTRTKVSDTAAISTGLSYLAEFKKDPTHIPAEAINAVGNTLSRAVTGAGFKQVSDNMPVITKFIESLNPIDSNRMKQSLGVAYSRRMTELQMNANDLTQGEYTIELKQYGLGKLGGTEPDKSPIVLVKKNKDGTVVDDSAINYKVLPYVMAAAQVRMAVTGETYRQAIGASVKSLAKGASTELFSQPPAEPAAQPTDKGWWLK